MLKDILPEFSVGLSPMDDITSDQYRSICKEYGADILYTEFVSSDALVRDVEKTYKKIAFDEGQRPLGIQIFGNSEETLSDAAQRVEQLHPDFIDINWGCPVKKVAGKGSGSGILNDIDRMISITAAVVKAVKTPVTVKTRLGYSEDSKPIVEIAERLQDVGVQMIAIHGRTRAQMYKGEADWTLIGEVKNNPRMTIPVLGNGDIDSAAKMLEYKNRYGVDGILIGRAAVGNPFIFRQCRDVLEGREPFEPTLKEKVTVCYRHLMSLMESNTEFRALTLMKKFYSRYFLGVSDFKPYKMRLMQAESADGVKAVLDEIISQNLCSSE